ncbi:hypothetical protein L211DRAFT_253526 [Terfezia boudieri ATCC MYA-4762]|uniref:Zn(2)-C6 fungal-type domain-containing protein n=1 Tax=Terfezia boudieri ATCC MYA-4762 TaxID=1051890 RepID=A0A3N4MLM4_9PEZI|nr:hypothetical protein L211DRAFT_253526 [Terfezia boudieri ATCC MYA-4762]
MYPTSPVSPVMSSESKSEKDVGIHPSAGDTEQKRYDIKAKGRPTSSRIKSPSTETVDSRNEYKTRSPSSLSPRKRKQSPDSKSDTEVPKRSRTSLLYPNSENKMSLDINDIGMPGRSGSTRSRTKVPAQERRRVPVACDSCRHRKIKCNGEIPCQNCCKNSYDCNFPPVSAKIVVEENWVERLQGRCGALERALIEAIPDPEKREELAAQYGLRLMMTASPSERSESEPSSTSCNPMNGSNEGVSNAGYDTEAYSFIGDSAGLTFMNKIREFVRATIPFQSQMNNFLDPIQVFLASAADSECRSAPLSLPSTDPYILPHKPTVASLIQRFISFLGCGSTPDTASPSGGVYYWFDPDRLSRDLDTLYTSVNMGLLGIGDQSRPVDYTVLCMVNAVLALACQSTASSAVGPLDVEEEAIARDAYFWTSFVPRRTSNGDRSLTPDQAFTPTSPHSTLSEYGESQSNYFTVTDYNTRLPGPMASNTSTFQPGMTFFARAKALMVSPSDAPSLSTLRTLSMLAYFLLSANRWEAAYLHIGLAVRLAVANGLHRRRALTEILGLPEVDIRNKQREEEDKRRTFWTIYILDRLVSCMTGRPVMLGDEAIDTELPLDIEGLPSASGLRAHVQLSKIMGDIITKVYPIRRSGDTAQTQHQLIMQAIKQSHAELNSWHENLPAELKLVNGVARERGVLWLHSLYNELLMLTCRPDLLLAMKRTSASIHSPSQSFQALPAHVYEHANICTNAAGSNLLLARQIQASGWVHASFTECTYVFNAGMTLVLARLIAQGGPEWPGRQHEEDIQYAIAFLSTLGKGGNLSARKYTKDLVGLDAAVTRLIEARNLNVSLQALGGSPTGMSLPAVTVAPGLVPTMTFQPELDFALFGNTDYPWTS